MAGSKGSPDLARDVRGFAVKFYTKAGNWDLVGNNIPVFFIQDALKFPDLIHSAKEEPDCGFPQAQTAHDNFWDFISLSPESMHMVMWIMSDRTLPRSFRFMEGFGVHTFRMINAKGISQFVKFHWKPKLGLQSVLWDEAVKINGADPDFHRKDLWNAIQKGDYPEWELGLQVFDEAFCKKFDFDVLDATKLIPEELVPIKYVGRLVLDKCVDNFFAETEQVAFCTQNIVPGIDFSNDPLLQGRNFSYLDTQLKRLGSPNFSHIPINAPKCPMHLFQQDGHMAMSNPTGRINYEPNSWEQGPRENPKHGFKTYPAQEEGKKTRERPESFADHYSQARQFYLSQTDIEQQHIIDALIFELSKVQTASIRERIVSHLLNIEKTLAKRVAQGLGMNSLPKAAKSAKAVKQNLKNSEALSIILNRPKKFSGRKIGMILTEGASADIYNEFKKLVIKEGANLEIIAPNITGVTLDDDSFLSADETIHGGPSVLYDAIILLPAANSDDSLPSASINSFIQDAFNHLKFIAYTASAEPLLKKANLYDKLDAGCFLIEKKKTCKEFIEACRELRCWERSKLN